MPGENFEIINFSTLLFQEVSEILENSQDGVFREAAFTQQVLEFLSDADETGNCQVCTSVSRNRTGNRVRQINAYGLWDDYETLDLFITDYQGEGAVYTLEKNRITTAFNLALKYLRYLQKGEFGFTEESAAEMEFISNFNEFSDKILRIRIILITDGMVRTTLPVAPLQGEGPTIIYEAWDLQRIYQVWSSQGKREPIEIDMPLQFGQHIECLSVSQQEDQYSAYLAVIPAGLLADLYNVYGTRLLEQNVRVYLQNLGKVNREIRKTILESPGMFMAYNNGISATATDVVFETNIATGKPFIRYIKGLQIVNGGQTTSSIYYARKKDRADLSKIHVQMKITQVHDDMQMEGLVSRISKYANSQNKVSEIDLTSNQPFQIRLEELSRTTWADPPGSTGRQTRWFYERVKGQYKEELNKEHTKSRQLTFKNKNPPHQVIRKEELAKYHNSWNLKPFWVSRGSQKNYLQFIAEEGSVQSSRQYYKDHVSMAILFKAAETIYGKKPYSLGDLRYLVVPYALAWLNYHTAQRLDLSAIWLNQSVSKELWTLLKSILIKVNEFLQKKPDNFALIGEWAKREDCWTALSAILPEQIDIDLSSVKADLMTATPEVLKSTDSVVSAHRVAEWEAVETAGRERLRFDLFEINVIRNVIRRLKNNKTIPEQLSEHAMKLMEVYQQELISAI
ncbi:MAG TPA: AIPR family protein [Mucilaginibacter sp.]|nr:AIPR family protein [Mucilaginibacter sp.]